MGGIGAEPKLLGSFDLVWKYQGHLDQSKEARLEPTVDSPVIGLTQGLGMGIDSEGNLIRVLFTCIHKSFLFPVSFRGRNAACFLATLWTSSLHMAQVLTTGVFSESRFRPPL